MNPPVIKRTLPSPSRIRHASIQLKKASQNDQPGLLLSWLCYWPDLAREVIFELQRQEKEKAKNLKKQQEKLRKEKEKQKKKQLPKLLKDKGQRSASKGKASVVKDEPKSASKGKASAVKKEQGPSF